MAAGLLLAACQPSQEEDQQAIRAQMHRLYDRANQTLEAGPLAISGDTAVADWTQGNMGGRALFRRERTQWRIILCAGEVLQTEKGLASVGVSAPDATRIAASLAESESTVSPHRLHLIASFEGVMRMDAPPEAH
jgi:hypothetical protein